MKPKTDILTITRSCDRCAYEVRIFRKHCNRCGYLINPEGLYHLLPNVKDAEGYDLEDSDYPPIDPGPPPF